MSNIMETEEYSGAIYDVSSEDDEFSMDSFDDSECQDSDHEMPKTNEIVGSTALSDHKDGKITNLVFKLRNREYTGCFLEDARKCHVPQRAFSKVPNRLGFCLKDIVPHCFLQGHMFMGLSACGQFLLSYKVSCNDNIRISHYSMNIGYNYTLYFWIYQPHKPLRSFYKCCLFDDHGVDNLKQVTVTQWKNAANPRVLIVHGAAEDENEDSYITYVKVPKLGCLDCKKLRDSDADGFFRWYPLCLKCNLTIHTKYSSTESDRKFDPYTNLICPDRILIVSNGFMHMLHVDVEQPAPLQGTQSIASHGTPSSCCFSPRESVCSERRVAMSAEEPTAGSDHHNNIVARIIADFSDIETDSTHSGGGSRHGDGPHNEVLTEVVAGVTGVTCITRKSCDELVLTCNNSSPIIAATVSCNAKGIEQAAQTNSSLGAAVKTNSMTTTKVSLVTHGGKRHHRIVTKSMRNCVTSVDLQGSTATTTSTAADKSNAYEFSEDNEKCEKIATLRKRRLADKKYEFSEDNSENIIPFTKIRSAGKSLSNSRFGSSSPSGSCGGGSNAAWGMHRPVGSSHHFLSSPCVSPSSSPHSPFASTSAGYDVRRCTPPPLHRASPIALQPCGFRSPPACSSTVGVGVNVMRSPGRHHVSPAQIYSGNKQVAAPPSLSPATQQMLSFKPLGTLSPLQVSLTKRSYMELGGSMSPNANVPFLSPRREEHRVAEVLLADGMTPEKPVCTKKFKRRYVEEDDAASVITSEEDDCISPGYHTSLPMEVHGSCYSEMQMISQASYQQLHCTSVVITQHSFDLEAFTYYVISLLCQKNNKTYDVFYDWACELIKVCPLSHTIICLLMAQFSAREQLPATPTNCLNCSRKLDCAFHRKHFECRILFTWNMESGEWEVLDYGELLDCKLSDLISPVKRSGVAVLSLAQSAKKLAHEMASGINRMQDYSTNLRVLDSNVKRSKACLVDHDNMIEFYLKRPLRRV